MVRPATPSTAWSSSDEGGSPRTSRSTTSPWRSAGSPSRRRGSPSGSSTRRVHEGPVVDPAGRLDELGQHPVGGRRVVLEAGARLPVEPPGAEPLEALLPAHGGGDVERCAGEAALVDQELLDGDRSLPVVAPPVDDVGHRLIEREHPVGQLEPHRAGDERLRAGEDDVAGVVAGGAEGLEGDQLAVAGHRHLAGRQQALVDLASGPGHEGFERGGIDPQPTGVGDRDPRSGGLGHVLPPWSAAP